MNGVGWLAAIIIGGFAGWLAEKFMKSDMGLMMNIVLGIVGAVVLNAILGFLGLGTLGVGWIAYLITGFIGACLLIYAGRLLRK
ncbi:GlsB/YeaQ/YmgE family stress response membrane protein [Oricola sp.]|uniref:GlsB/YeaQ/YmgE family stress response membrane protein n=1 Tax=Oricola sp. TaxID=1979950 RepID=UPI0025CDC866|nr:GlsB/YeaQ/YmgE family stress response membrane protein [Oricola sp.]MCI5075921.1 GlsB/YeaQ/YmgE family stress response membrane protein [Oricola sp.]